MKFGSKIFSGVVLAVIIMNAGCSKQGSVAHKSRYYPTKDSRVSYDIPIVVNDDVKRWVHAFKTNLRGRFSLYLTRSGRYEGFMRQILSQEGLPQDLVYLAMIESGFSNHAYSRARAVGPWQFIRSTGRLYGLKNNEWVDERRDPQKATIAAAKYLKNLYKEFDDWYLAMAAYNAGEGKVRRAIHHARSRDFWDIASPRSRYLKSETKNYVPKFIAAALIAKDPKRHGFHVQYEDPLTFEIAEVKGPLDLEVAAELAGSDEEEIKRLNPELKMGMTPHGNYELKIPLGTKEEFQMAYAQLPPSERVRVAYHQVKRGETVGKIARRYGISTNSLMASNGLTQKKARFLKPGSRLVIPKRGKTSGILLAANESKPTRKRMNGVAWLIRKDNEEKGGEPAEVADVPEKQTAPPVLDEKGMENSGLPAVEETNLGEETKPVVIEPKVIKQFHVVKRGDNLWKIAKTYGVEISDLKRWNNMQNAHRLKLGIKLVVQN